MSSRTYIGTIVEESLVDNRFLNTLDIHGVRITSEDDPQKRWHLYHVQVSPNDLEKLSQNLKPKRWYAHFWKEDDMYVVFPGRIFKQHVSDETTWKAAIEYGLALQIPLEQLDFKIQKES